MGTLAYAVRHRAPVATGNQTPICRCVITLTCPQGPVVNGIPLGQLGIEGINNNDALPLTVLTAVTFTPDLTPVHTNPVGRRSRAHSLDSALILLKAVIIGWGEGGPITHWMTFSNSQVSPTTTEEHWNAPARMVLWQPAQYLSELVQEIWVRFLGEVSQTRSNHWEQIQEDKQAGGGRATKHGKSSQPPLFKPSFPFKLPS